MSEKELMERIKDLEEKLEQCKKREEELESMLNEYNEIIKKQFEAIDSFFENLGTKRIVDPLTRVYTKDHILKLLSHYHQKAFEENVEYALFSVKLSNLDDFKGMDKEKVLMISGKVLKECVRVPLDNVGRYSENIFLLIVTEVGKEVCGKIEKRIMDAFKSKLPSLNVEISYAFYPEEFEDLDKALEKLTGGIN